MGTFLYLAPSCAAIGLQFWRFYYAEVWGAENLPTVLLLQPLYAIDHRMRRYHSDNYASALCGGL